MHWRASWWTLCRHATERGLSLTWYASYRGNHAMEHSSRALIWMQGTEYLVEKAEVEARETEPNNVWLRKEYAIMYIIHSFH